MSWVQYGLKSVQNADCAVISMQCYVECWICVWVSNSKFSIRYWICLCIVYTNLYMIPSNLVGRCLKCLNASVYNTGHFYIRSNPTLQCTHCAMQATLRCWQPYPMTHSLVGVNSSIVNKPNKSLNEKWRSKPHQDVAICNFFCYMCQDVSFWPVQLIVLLA